ncbi:MAG TPA: hypothetical protein VGL56_04865 [Fimbriimonadaceae bacterium]|jgi:hypothetical protein
MVGSLSHIFKEASKLPKEEQEALAAIIAEEMQDEERWSKSFASTQDQLKQMAEAARKEISAGTVRAMRS